MTERQTRWLLVALLAAGFALRLGWALSRPTDAWTIEQLPDRQRDAIVYRLIEGRSTKETAELMGCAEGTVKALLHHAVQRV